MYFDERIFGALIIGSPGVSSSVIIRLKDLDKPKSATCTRDNGRGFTLRIIWLGPWEFPQPLNTESKKHPAISNGNQRFWGYKTYKVALFWWTSSIMSAFHGLLRTLTWFRFLDLCPLFCVDINIPKYQGNKVYLYDYIRLHMLQKSVYYLVKHHTLVI